MYLFYRSARLGGGNIREQLEWALQITEKVNQIVENPTSLWTRVFSPGVNTLCWTASAESMASFEASEDKLLSDNGYIDLVEKAAKWQTSEGIDDGLMQLVHVPDEVIAAPAYTAVVSATLNPGYFAAGIEAGVEIAQRAQRASGSATSFAVATTGGYGTVAWITGFASIERVEAEQQALNSSQDFINYLDKDAKDCFIPGSATQTLFRRIH